jgi:indole-3-glycerol phosphate synthase
LIFCFSFFHYTKVARALENGAGGVLLNAQVLGKQLESLLNACTFMGTDAIVEVHTPADLELAIEAGATIILINMWCRESGKLFPNQVTIISLGFGLSY